MKLIVNPHKIEIEKTPVNEKEIDITKIQFEFNNIPSNYVKDAYFTYNGTSYKVLIQNNECSIPYEVLNKSGMVEIGVVAYLVEDETEIKRYNPSPVYISTLVGSLKEDYENTESVTPSDKEQMEQILQDGLSDIQTAITNASRLDIDAEKVDKTTTITITKQDGSQTTTEILDGNDGIDGQDGASLENMVIDNRDLKVTYGGEIDNLGQVVPNIQVGTTTTVLPSANARVVNVGTDLNPILNFEIPKGDAGAIKIRIVNELPLTGDEDTFYLVPKQESETQDMYDEYVWINNTWELVGEKQIEVDLSDYYTKSETNTLLVDKVGFTDYPTNDGTKSGVIKVNVTDGISINTSNNRLQAVNTDYGTYQSSSNSYIIGKGTLENVITGKGLVSNTNYASESVAGVIKVNNTYRATSVSSSGSLQTTTKTYQQYQGADNEMFIGKGTLENVITGKDLTTKSYVDGLVGDINSALDTINGEVI